jgi:SAM-dependent methyltransferase
MPPLLKDLAARFTDGTNETTGYVAGSLYELYDSYFAELVEKPISLLELSVYTGESLKAFASYFYNGRIIGLDIEDRHTDFSAHPNVTFVVGDQKYPDELATICSKYAPDGIDIIIDDASYFDTWSLISYKSLYPYLKPGGFYFIEDWAAGYWDDWPDGGRFQEFEPGNTEGQIGKRISSHDFGIVGFVKYLVDEVMGSGIRPTRNAPLNRPRKLDLMHVHREMVVLRKTGLLPP